MSWVLHFHYIPPPLYTKKKSHWIMLGFFFFNSMSPGPNHKNCVTVLFIFCRNEGAYIVHSIFLPTFCPPRFSKTNKHIFMKLHMKNFVWGICAIWYSLSKQRSPGQLGFVLGVLTWHDISVIICLLWYYSLKKQQLLPLPQQRE